MGALKKEIQNLKNIIEIGKVTVEQSKQLSIDLAKDNKKKQMKEAEYESHLKALHNRIKKLEDEISKKDADISKLSGEGRSRRDIDSLQSKLKQKCAELKEAEDSLKKLKQEGEKAVYEQEEKTKDAQKIKTELQETKEKEEFYLSQCEHLKKSGIELAQEVEKLRKQLVGHDNLKMLYDILQIKYNKEREARETEGINFQASRDDFEQQTNHLMADIESMKVELSQLKQTNENLKERVEAQESELRTKNQTLGQLNEEAKNKQLKLERFDDISARLNVMSRREEDLKKKCEKMAAEIKVQGWEIENYKNKLIGAEMIIAGLKDVEFGADKLKNFCSTFPPGISLPSFLSSSSSSCSNNNTPKEDYVAEYCENPLNQESIAGPSDVKIEVPDVDEEKDVTQEQRDNQQKRMTANKNDEPVPKKMKK